MFKSKNVAVVFATLICLCFYGGTAYAAYTARAFAMGDAFTAVADDYSALYYNPAGLGQHIFGMGAGVTMNEEAMRNFNKKKDVFDIDRYEYQAELAGITLGGLGVGVNKVQASLPDVVDDTPIVLGQLSTQLTAGYGWSIGRGANRIGLAVDAITVESSLYIKDYADYYQIGKGWALRAGFLMQLSEAVTLGACVDNLGAINWGSSGTDRLSPGYRVGGALKLPAANTVLAADLDSDGFIHMGGETHLLWKFISFRYGKISKKGASFNTAGLGINLRYAHIDLGFQVSPNIPGWPSNNLTLAQVMIRF